jgi:hypothetical protein
VVTDDLAAMSAFAEARLAEDEATVRYAGPARIAWLTYRDDEGQMLYTTVAAADGCGPWVADGKELPEPASVLTMYDPARALRDIESARKLLAVIQAMPHLHLDEDSWYSCSQAADPHPGPWGNGPGSGCLDENRAGKPCDCGRDARARRLLAAIVMRWATHPDYLPGWAPEAVGG